MRHALTVAVGPAVFRIGADRAAPITALRRLYASYPPPDRPADFTVRLPSPVLRRFIRPQVAIDGDYAIAGTMPLPLSQGLLAAEMAMNLQLAFGWREQALIHASAVARPLDAAGSPHGAILMPGQSGSGKSTLAALIGEGVSGTGAWRLMGDEFTLLTLDGRRLLAMPRPVSLKNDAIATLGFVTDPARWGPRLVGTPKGTIRHLLPRPDALAAAAVPARPVAIIFPRFGDAASLRAIEPAETFVRLTEATSNYVALGAAAFEALVTLANSAPAFDISYPDSAGGIELVKAVWDACRGLPA